MKVFIIAVMLAVATATYPSHYGGGGGGKYRSQN